MSLYSIFKVSKDEIKYILDNPLTTFNDLKTKYNLELTSIYKNDLDKNLYTILKSYLEKNAKLANIDTSKYKRWLTEQESNKLLSELNKQNTNLIYNIIYNKVR
jgi:hypothetical protein